MSGGGGSVGMAKKALQARSANAFKQSMKKKSEALAIDSAAAAGGDEGGGISFL